MKTYWLEKKVGWTQPRIQEQELETTNQETCYDNERRGSNLSRNYSPVTYHEVSRSLTSTPVPDLTNEACCSSRTLPAGSFIFNNYCSNRIDKEQNSKRGSKFDVFLM